MKCRLCSCTDEHACDGGCSWVPGEGNLCSVCYEIVLAVKEWLESARRPSWAALKREASNPPKAMAAGAGGAL